jgi:hypothetical protein
MNGMDEWTALFVFATLVPFVVVMSSRGLANTLGSCAQKERTERYPNHFAHSTVAVVNNAGAIVHFVGLTSAPTTDGRSPETDGEFGGVRTLHI